jgi:hypothetical protein
MVELAPRHQKSVFGTLNQLGIAVGFVLCYTLSSVTNWWAMGAIGALWPLMLAFFVAPFSSRGVPESDVAEESREERGNPMREILRWSSLMLFQQGTGINVFLLNLRTMLEGSKGDDAERQFEELINEGDAFGASLGAFAQVIACLFSTFLMPHWKQRTIWIISLTGCALTNFAYAVVESSVVQRAFQCDFSQCAPTHKCLSFGIIFAFLFSFGFGAGPIPWFGVPSADTEFLPLKLRAMAMTIVSCLNWGLVALVMKLRNELAIGNLNKLLFHCVFGGCSAVGAILGWFFLPLPRGEVKRTRFTETDILATYTETTQIPIESRESTA